MSSELKPCPFCGWPKPVRYGAEVECPQCMALVKSGISTYDAIEKWNRRDGQGTCHVVPDGCVGRCSACGDDVFADPEHDGGYCPSCGAKVVNDDE